MRWFAFLVMLAVVAARAGAGTPLDSSRYMHVADVRPGMTGYGLTVFRGTKIDKFNVEVVDVLRNLINPKCDVILINCPDAYMEHVGPVEGMSGSPIFLFEPDDTAHAHPKLVGAFAYGWEWSKDALAGVQPIDYMLTEVDAAGGMKTASADHARRTWSLADVPPLPGFACNAAGYPAKFQSKPHSYLGGLRPLATPLTASGIPPSVAASLAPMFSAVGMNLLQAGGAAEATTQAEDIKMEPGSVLVAPLLMGDIEMSAAGTCTEVVGNRVLAFGHDFNNEGQISLPMATGRVATIVADVHSSFKLAEMEKICGTLTNDQTIGVAGTLGKGPAMIPIRLHIHYADGTLDQTYNFSAALHDKFTPLVAAAAMQTVLAGVKDLPQYHTLDYDLSLTFAGDRVVRISNTDANGQPADLAQQLALPITAASDNPFLSVPLERIEGTINVSDEVHLADITAVTLPKVKFEPGVSVKAFVNFRPWRGEEQTLPIQFDLPKDLPDGDYQCVVSDYDRFFTDEKQAEPFEFTAESIDDLFSVLKDFESMRHDAIYVRLVRQPDGVAAGRTALLRLPASVRQAMLESQRSDLTPFISSSVQSMPTDREMSGAAEFTLTIERQAHVESSHFAKPAAPGTQPS